MIRHDHVFFRETGHPFRNLQIQARRWRATLMALKLRYRSISNGPAICSVSKTIDIGWSIFLGVLRKSGVSSLPKIPSAMVKSVAVSSLALAPVAKRRNIRGLNDAASSDRSSASDRITASVAGDLRASVARYGPPRKKRSARGEPAGYELREEPHALRLACLPLCEKPERSVHVQVGARHPHQ